MRTPRAVESAPIVSTPEPPNSQEATRLLARALMRKAEAARENLEEFYRFVIRHETTKQLLEPTPHQKVLFSFITHHRFKVARLPVGTGKSYIVAAYTLFMLGKDPTARNAIISKVARMAQKPMSMVSDYITEPELNARLHLVFPELRKSERAGDAWSKSNLTVKRPAGIRDASVSAVGIGMVINGARLSGLFGDDSIDAENSKNAEIRDKTISGYESHQLNRLDPATGMALFTNTPWHREDATYYLENVRGWPTITMDIYGFVTIKNADAAWLAMAEQKYLRPSTTRPGKWRLREFDPDPDEETVLWPQRYSRKTIEAIRYGENGGGGMLPHTFAQTFLCEPLDEGTERCQRGWIEKCKIAGLGLTLLHRYSGGKRTYCGIDLGIGTKKKHDKTVFFVFELSDKNVRRVLMVESGRWSGKEIVAMIINYAERYGCSFFVEDNQGQEFLRQWAISDRPDLMIRAHNTNAQNKRDVDFGVESLFSEMQNAAWIFPCDHNGALPKELQLLADGALYYNPNDHTSDHLMAMWIAREGARRGSATGGGGSHGKPRELIRSGGGF